MKTEPLPNAPSGWHDYSLITNLRPLSQEKEFNFPSNLLPSAKFAVVNEYSNFSLELDEYDTTLTLMLGALPGIGSVFLIGAGIPVLLNINLSRKEGWSICGSNTPIRNIQAPKFGFSIGNVFKHQAYISLNIVGMGVTGSGGKIVWLTAPATSAIEYSTNSRLKKFIVKYGKVIDVKTGTETIEDKDGNKTTENRIYVKLFENTDSADNEKTTDEDTADEDTEELSSGIPSGSVIFCGSRAGGMVNGIMVYKGMTADWYAIFENPQIEDPDAFVPSRGDFYSLNKPIICENPQTMFEFNVRVEDEVYITNEQKYKLETNVIGVWIYDDVLDLQIAYVDKEKRNLVHLPSGGGSYVVTSGKYITSGEEGVSGEYHDFGGDLKAGLEILRSKSTLPETVRLIFENTGSTLQNFCSGNLIGEYVKFGKDYYEIVNQPRLDTVEVGNYSVSNLENDNGSVIISSKVNDEDPKDAPSSIGAITIYQQKFWKIAELYGLTGTHDGAFKALWSGQILSLEAIGTNEYEVKWKTSESYMHLFLPSYEIERTKINTLPERFRTKAEDKGVINGYYQNSGWELIINNIAFKVIDFEAKEDVSSQGGSETEITITATVQGDPSTYASVGTNVYVVLEEPFDTAFGTTRPSNSSVAIWTAIGKTNGMFPKPALYMYGYYDAGKYSLPGTLGVTQRLAISSFAYGIDSQLSYLGVPATWVSTYSSSSGVAYLQHGNTGQQTILYKDPELGVISAITADPGWIERRTKSTITCGLQIYMEAQTKDDKGESIASVPSDDSYMLTGIYGKVSNSNSNSTNISKGYFAVIPASSETPYHAVKISGYGGIETPLTRKTLISISNTDVHPVQLPLEIYEPLNTEGESITIGTSVMAKTSQVTLSGCGFQEIKGHQIFEEIKKGSQLPTPIPEIKASSFRFSKARQVLQGVKQFNAHMLDNGNVLLFYSKDSSKFYFDGADIQEDSNLSRPSTFVAMSSANIDSFGSPKFDRKNLDLNTLPLSGDESEWERPLMLAYDFDFSTSLRLWGADEILIFGYGYSRNDDNESRDNDSSYLFLGCYLTTLQGLQSGDTYKCKLSIAGESAEDDIATHYYYRPNHINSKVETYNMDFGAPLKGGSVIEEIDTSLDVCTERFTRIIGGTNSGAYIGGDSTTTSQPWELSKDVIGVDTASHGMISVYFRDPSSDSILRIWSCTRGDLWDIEVEDPEAKSSSPIRYATGSSPTLFQNLLFYFYGDSLYCKDLSSVSEGSYFTGVYGSKQEQLDNLSSSLVASDVVGHKVAPNIDPYGRVVVFYLSKSGNVQAAGSNSSGQTWSYLNNW